MGVEVPRNQFVDCGGHEPRAPGAGLGIRLDARNGAEEQERFPPRRLGECAAVGDRAI